MIGSLTTRAIGGFLNRSSHKAAAAPIYTLSQRYESDKNVKNNGDDLKHPYWESSGPDDFGLMDELQEFGDDIDFDLPEEDKEFLKREWRK
ncbi:fatty acid elongase [Perkinsela sp. CCAP 1560/4]|nr:fatty acid elongase [Perkinsela sp. CCAP 1560/4]|eukprot:KNH05596.1 fatty acid elongase [Perkinsela sp. CCAP 1560/4]